ncbi:hypothetical protein HK103_006727 [Boothiomyces macroporosus]|uniref:AAA+ ATPase domain-containing protein n=1 Tax=Boothiomyces macroporosus TaxID=261099 RepID=A0AAD5Y2C8_9FUNG|nr:hypothetical protein HK103_006727 [Boothiomyces macroporosus]
MLLENDSVKEHIFAAMVLGNLGNETAIIFAEVADSEILPMVVRSWFKCTISIPSPTNAFKVHMNDHLDLFSEEQLQVFQKNNTYGHLDFIQLKIELDLCRDNSLFSTMDDVQLDTKTWKDIGGYKTVKQKLEQSLVWKFKKIDTFKALGIEPPKGAILYGPPGNGKTHFAKCLAGEAGVHFIAVSISNIIKGEVGESEKAIQKLFRDARTKAPTIIFFDEVDALFTDRTRDDLSAKLYSQLVAEIDEINSFDSISVLAATNHLELIDSALLRPGRIDFLIHVDYPNESSRREILTLLTKEENVNLTDMELDNLVIETAGSSCADLGEVVRRLSLNVSS